MRDLKSLFFLALSALYLASSLGCSGANPVTGGNAPPLTVNPSNAATVTTMGGWQPTNDGAVQTQFASNIRLQILPPNRMADPECGSENDMDHSHSVFPGKTPVVTLGRGQSQSGPWDLSDPSPSDECGEFRVSCSVPLKDENGQNILEEKNGVMVMKSLTYRFVQIQALYCEKRGEYYQLEKPLVMECPDQVTKVPISMVAVTLDFDPCEEPSMMMPPPAASPNDPQSQQILKYPKGRILP